MLWYILYPLRGTTEAPVLPPDHPLRTAFSRYGTWTARHVKTVLPLSVALVFCLLYPIFFLYTTDATNVTSGVSNLPHHVWTDAQPLSERAVAEPDVIMRSVWVHGSYMKALDREILLGALELQDTLLGPTTNFNPRRPHASRTSPSDSTVDMTRDQRDAFHIVNGLTDQSWFFHSPLQYWGGSADNIAADNDIVSTVNEKKTQSTSVNITLRHSFVFSGKRFEERRLVAADALVITLIHFKDSPLGRQWVRNAERLAAQVHDKWTVIPHDGKSMASQLYEFQFRPMSWPDWFLLTIAYSLTLFYLLLSLSKLRAVKSRFGLMATILAQIAASIGSSFTICAIFKIDLSRIPYYAYPLVVLAISMENSFRLINAVIMTSSSISISDRIGEAFGQTAYVAILNRLQNLAILLGLSRITFPGVAAFCTFAAVAIVFDFLYLATFFLAVLSVDVRQRELYELEKASLRKTNDVHEITLLDRIRRIRHGGATVSTRVAGTIVILGFILLAQSHYALESGSQWLNWIFTRSWRVAEPAFSKSSHLVDIHQARSPTSWLRLQDHETAREVINVVKPWAHSYVARVYEPLVFVAKGANRIPHSPEPMFLPAVYDFVHNEIPRFVVIMLTLVALLLLLTNYLLQGNDKQAGDPDHPENEPLLSVRSLSHGHDLDVVKMAVSPGHKLVSVGLDRNIQIWDVPLNSRTRVMSDSETPLENPFPVLAMAIDDDSKWLALLTWQRVLLWDTDEQQWGLSIEVELGGHKPEAMFFNYTNKTLDAPSLVVVRKNGTMFELDLEGTASKEFTICKTPFAMALPFVELTSANQVSQSLSILTLSRKSCIHIVRQQPGGWTSKEVKLATGEAKDIHSIVPAPDLSMYLICRSRSVDLVDLESSAVIQTFNTEPMEPRSLKLLLSSRGAPQHGLPPLSLCYISLETGDLVIQTFHRADEVDPIHHPNEYAPKATRQPWNEDKEVKKRIEKPGRWEILPNGGIVGVRRVPVASLSSRRRSFRAVSSGVGVGCGLRRRGVGTGGTAGDSSDVTTPDIGMTVWEAWAFNNLESAKTKGIETQPLDQQADEEDAMYDNLWVSELGPMVRLGTASVAVGLGNVIKVISVGHEHFDKVVTRDRLTAENLRNQNYFRRRKTGSAAQRARGGLGGGGTAAGI
ncbi:sterol-sensing domain of SREBP cleavage-activation domain-containing protein [Neurospora intermedia]|uniref:Sterol regulatory element-binding protein cleavage-activating protein n=1 Tax=Neurospora intermedia TaxID=5142 RepID=A0ABR3D3X1_NEUIN